MIPARDIQNEASGEPQRRITLCRQCGGDFVNQSERRCVECSLPDNYIGATRDHCRCGGEFWQVVIRRCLVCGLMADEPRAWEVKCQCGQIHEASKQCPVCKAVVSPPPAESVVSDAMRANHETSYRIAHEHEMKGASKVEPAEQPAKKARK